MKPLRSLVLLAVTIVSGVMATPALASFPGQNGALAVTPLRGPGVVLVDVNGRRHGALCATRSSSCQGRFLARWSSDGRTLVLSPETSSGLVQLVYPDGSCLNCDAVGGQTGAAFTPNPAVVSVIVGGVLSDFGIDGLPDSRTMATGVSDAVWSHNGQLAVVRHGWVWIGRPGSLRRLVRGRSPSWSPDGARLAVASRGWVWIVWATGQRLRALVPGSAPAWSPDGRQIAFFAPAHRLEVIPASGGHSRVVGRIRGLAVDWQPVPASPIPPCATPPQSRVMAQSATGIVTSDGGSPPFTAAAQPVAAMGCLFADGRERLLFFNGLQTEDGAAGVVQAATFGDYAGLVGYQSDFHYGGISEAVTVYDLRTGTTVQRLGGESITCPTGYSADGSVGDLVINAQGYTAAVASSQGGCTIDQGSVPVQQLQVSDSQGVRVVDSASGLQPHITGLVLAGDTLTWQHDGQPESVQLH